MTDTIRTNSGLLIRPLTLHSKHRHTAKVYHFVFKAGWVIFTICDATGELSVQSDWGCWGFRWSTDPKHIGHPTLTDFLRDRASRHYVANKLSYSMPVNAREVPDGNTTGRVMKEHVIEQRREGRCDKREAREIWEQIEDLMVTYEDGGPEVAYYNMSRELSDFLGDGWEMFHTEEAPCLVVLRERLLPFLFEELRGEQEKQASA